MVTAYLNSIIVLHGKIKQCQVKQRVERRLIPCSKVSMLSSISRDYDLRVTAVTSERITSGTRFYHSVICKQKHGFRK